MPYSTALNDVVFDIFALFSKIIAADQVFVVCLS